MIYFDTPSKEIAVQKLSGVLKHGGYFIIGGAESLNGLKHNLKYIEPSVYQKCWIRVGDLTQKERSYEL